MFFPAQAMFHKRKVDLSNLREPDQKRFRHNVSNLFLTKTVSARRANELMKDAQIAGATGVKDLVKGAEKSGSGEKQAKLGKNLARDMKRKMLKNCLWFNEYIALIPCYNPGTQTEEMKKIPFFCHMRFFLSSRSDLRRKTCCRLVACVNSARNIWQTCKCSSKFERPWDLPFGSMAHLASMTEVKLWNASD